MRTTINLDDASVAEAMEGTGIAERTLLVHDGLRALVDCEAAHRVARLGGSAPRVTAGERHRPSA